MAVGRTDQRGRRRLKMERRRTAQFVMTVGPGEASERIRRALSEPVYYHEDPEFMALFEDTEKKLRAVFQTQQDVICLLYTSPSPRDS